MKFLSIPSLASVFVVVPLFGAEPVDTLEMQDGSLQSGTVVELGGNSVELRIFGGSKRVLKRDIKAARFSRERIVRGAAESDFVIRRSGHRIEGEVQLLDDGRRVRVRLPGGSTAEIPRTDILRIVRKGEALESDTTMYTAELGKTLESSIESLLAASPNSATEGVSPATSPGASGAGTGTDAQREAAASSIRSAETLLSVSGIFAIQEVRAALTRAPAGSEGTLALERVARLYGLKEAMATEIEESENRVYEVLTSGSVKARCDLLLFVFPRFLEESVPLAEFLARDSLQDAVVRAWSVDFLRRAQRNRELLRVWQASVGPVQVASAIALGRNRILLGVPTLIEALELNSPEIRIHAAQSLVEFTGKDFGFRADGAPQARRDAIARWRKWWQENQEAVRRLAEATLQSPEGETEKRRLAILLWKEASKDIDAERPADAAAKLRDSLAADPEFFSAAVCLSLILALDLGKPLEAVALLEDYRTRIGPELASEERMWIHLYLGRVLEAAGKYEAAVEAYAKARAIDPSNLDALLGFAAGTFRVATSEGGQSPEERKRALRDALAAYEVALRVLVERDEELATVGASPLPVSEAMPFDRRKFNRSVLGLKEGYRLRRHEIILRVARIQVLLGATKDALLALRGAADSITLEPGEEAAKLQVSIRSSLGILYEESGQPHLAYREYRRILDGLDPSNPESLRGVERLKKTLEGDAAKRGR